MASQVVPTKIELALCGGTFDPVHVGHLALLQSLLSDPSLEIKRLLVMPAGAPPHKSSTSPGPQRWLWLSLALKDLLLKYHSLELSDWELKQPGPSYTVHTVDFLLKTFGLDRIWLILGTDMFDYLPQWHQWELLLQKVGLIVIHRSGLQEPDVPKRNQLMQKIQEYGTPLLHRRYPDVPELSSHQLRTLARSHDNPSIFKDLIPEPALLPWLRNQRRQS